MEDYVAYLTSGHYFLGVPWNQATETVPKLTKKIRTVFEPLIHQNLSTFYN